MNNITIELCAEDRARLDRLYEVGEAIAIQLQALLDKDAQPKLQITKLQEGDPGYTPHEDDVASMTKDDIAEAAREALARSARIAQDEPSAIDHPTLDPFPEPSAQPEESSEAAPEETKPDVTMDMLRSKAITLAAAGKKDQVREVVHPYAAKVTELPADKWAEVYEKLCEMEG